MPEDNPFDVSPEIKQSLQQLGLRKTDKTGPKVKVETSQSPLRNKIINMQPVTS